ncbi:MAG: hypothetical protein AB1345_00185 [Chloroflexota bacterium]
MIPAKSSIKKMLGELPLTAEVYWHIMQSGKPIRGFKLKKLARALPVLCEQAASSQNKIKPQRKVLLFATLPHWVAHTTVLGLALAGLGNEVSLAYLPYPKWQKPINRFDLRRHNAYVRQILAQAKPLIRSISWLDSSPFNKSLPAKLKKSIENQALNDSQYILQTEEVNLEDDLYRFRLKRNTDVACAALTWLQRHRPDVVIIPNGTILEFGAVYQVVKYLSVPVVTYEFDEKRGHLWLAQNSEVMLQETDDLWALYKDRQLSPEQWKMITSLFEARQEARLWEEFSRQWQNLPRQGSEDIHAKLGLDSRPIILLVPNLLGDSVTLKRQIFSKGMTDWLERTLQFFASRSGVQLVVRIHPNESLLLPHGTSMVEVARRALPIMPEHIHLIEADAQVNTYDLVEISNLGLAYTTTVGMEMSMIGIPVIVCGQTHYRGKGFTLDPHSWDEYFSLLESFISDSGIYRLSPEQIERAWNYAYFFYFDYPLPFPWHLLQFWDDLERWPLEKVLGDEGQQRFGKTFYCMVGEPLC